MKAKERRELDRWLGDRPPFERDIDLEELARKRAQIDEERRRRRVRDERDTDA